MKPGYYAKEVLKKLLRPLFNKFASLVGVPNIQQRLNLIESIKPAPPIDPKVFDLLERRVLELSQAQIVRISSEVEERALHAIAVLKADTDNRLHSLNEALVSFVDAKQEQNLDSIARAETSQSKLIAELRQSIDVIRRQSSAVSSSDNVQPNSHSSSSDQVIDDALYVSLENHFRGSRDIVAERQKEYLDLLPQTISESTPLVDLGCGRGEWLRVLQERGISAVGVDSNTVCAAECRELGLSVVEKDLLQYLDDQSDASIGAFTMFQVLEHLPFPVLVDVLRQIRRTLVPGGLLIAEVPNAKNLRVASGTFWIDPTHQRPLFPELLLFLATEVGFTQSKGRYVNDLSPRHDLSGIPQNVENALRSVLYAIDGPGDFALLAMA